MLDSDLWRGSLCEISKEGLRICVNTIQEYLIRYWDSIHVDCHLSLKQDSILLLIDTAP
jgi:hypothetical protein